MKAQLMSAVAIPLLAPPSNDHRFFFIARSYTLPQIVAQNLAPASMPALFVAIYFQHDPFRRLQASLEGRAICTLRFQQEQP
ncbi:hypothetical protein NUH86_18235 [Sphingobium sp. JS3065]|uniref:hypothetical protein n=1 Tax=Sphingobium sp. JS3065 TaxID=2970925 RepID=UPI0022643978|nr:hypothetical protein [Sphingobium sp. JS3065]UZW57521.1 hypothetical protein NUH86_18235 [Sphingobium sp. JS3065]